MKDNGLLKQIKMVVFFVLVSFIISINLQLLAAERQFDFKINNISELSENNIQVFPNPTESIFNIELTGYENQEIDAIIHDIEGKEIINTKEKMIDLSGRASGVYIIKIMIDGNIFESQIIKK